MTILADLIEIGKLNPRLVDLICEVAGEENVIVVRYKKEKK